MTREEAKKQFPLMQAYAEGKTIQIWDADYLKWLDVDEPAFSELAVYRIKPQPTYRPFKKAKECWEEMQKHQPFGWIRRVDDDGNEYYTNRGIDDFTNYEYYFDNFTFVDGTPFGVKNERIQS